MIPTLVTAESCMCSCSTSDRDLMRRLTRKETAWVEGKGKEEEEDRGGGGGGSSAHGH